MILHTENIGSGSETIIFLHSGLQTGMTDFEKIIPHFEDKYHVLLPDLRGHGKSKSLNLHNYFERTADDLMETIHHLNISRIHLVGVSLGALIAVHFALKYKSQVSSLTLSGLMFSEPHNYTGLHDEEVRMQTKLMGNQDTVSYFNDIHGSGWARFIDMSKSREWYPFDKNAAIIEENLPIHIVIGSKSEHELETINEYIKEKTTVTVVDNAGHLVNHDNAEGFSETIKNYIENI